MQCPPIVGVMLLGALLTATAPAQSNEEKKAAKLAEPWLANASWIMDFDEAKEAAAKDGKPIFAYFTRSYAP